MSLMDDAEREANQLRYRQPPLTCAQKGHGPHVPMKLNQTGDQVAFVQNKNELLRLLMAKNDLKACSRILGRSYPTILRWAKTPGFLDELKELSSESFAEVDEQIKSMNISLHERLEELQSKALDRLDQLLDSKNEKISLQAVETTLDRVEGTAKNTKAENEHHFKVDPMVLLHAAATAREIDQAQGRLIEGENG